MAVRQSYTQGGYSPDDSDYDPAGVFDMSTFSAPSVPMSGTPPTATSQPQAQYDATTPQNNYLSALSPSLSLYDPTTGQQTDPSLNPDPYQIPTGLQTSSAAPVTTPSPAATTPFTAQQKTGTTTPTTPTTPTTNQFPQLPGGGVNNGGLLSRVDSKGNVYNEDGTPMLDATGKQVHYAGVTGSYVPPPAAPGAPPPSTTPNTTSPLGNSVDQQLINLLNSSGMTPQQTSLLDYINSIIASGGAVPGDNTIEQQQMEQAREAESQAFTSQLHDTNDQLAAEGLASEPGVPQGSQAEALSRISQALAPTYAQNVQAIQTQEQQTQEARLQSAIQTATGLDSNAAGNLLSSLGTGNSRQLGLAQIALDSLGQDEQWQEFLANYGLTRDQILNQIQQGNSASLQTLISLFLQFASASSQGHV